MTQTTRYLHRETALFATVETTDISPPHGAVVELLFEDGQRLWCTSETLKKNFDEVIKARTADVVVLADVRQGRLKGGEGARKVLAD